jgi:hypothetical protein
MEKEIVCCAAPSLSVKNNRLHCEGGPAVSWPGGVSYYYIKGVQITKDILERHFTWQDIDEQNNAEVRRVMIELYGQARYIQDCGIKPVHSDDWGTLYIKQLPGDEEIRIVKVVNCSPEPDGSFKDYFIRVDPKAYRGVKIAWAAVASMWRNKDNSFAFKDYHDYCPCVET